MKGVPAWYLVCCRHEERLAELSHTVQSAVLTKAVEELSDDLEGTPAGAALDAATRLPEGLRVTGVRLVAERLSGFEP